MYLQLSLMDMEFEKLKKKIPTDLPMPEKKGRLRGNKNIFKVGPDHEYPISSPMSLRLRWAL